MKAEQSRNEINEAIQFITSRAEEQATRENQPLNKSELLALSHPPEEFFTIHIASDSGPVMPDDMMDRIVRLVMCAHEFDETLSPDIELRWRLAGLVLMIANHPVAKLMEAAGIKPHVEFPWWDKWLLWISALALVLVSVPIAILTDSEWTGIIAFSVLLGIVYFFSRQRERHYINLAVARCREALSHSKQSFA